MRFTLVAVALLLPLGGTASSEPPRLEDPFLERLTGSWVLRGTIAGKATTHDVSSEWVLGHLYVRIHEVSREKDGTGRALYEAIVLIGRDPATAEYQCLWLDSTAGGGLTPQAIARGKRAGDSVPFLFREADGTVSFNNTFAYDKAGDSWTWKMDNVKDGKPVPFGRVRLTRR